MTDDGLSNCMQGVKTTMTNESMFWFGTDYAKSCPVPTNSLKCLNPSPVPASMADRLFPAGSFEPELLTNYLDVTLHEKPGRFEEMYCNFPINVVKFCFLNMCKSV